MGKFGLPVTEQAIETVVHAVASELMSTLDEPIPPFSTRDSAKLQGALAAPFQSAFGQDIYPTIHEKAAALLYFVAKDHAFENGNKRIAVVSLLYYLAINDLAIAIDAERLYKITVSIVESPSSKDVLIASFAEVLADFCLPYDEWEKRALAARNASKTDHQTTNRKKN